MFPISIPIVFTFLSYVFQVRFISISSFQTFKKCFVDLYCLATRMGFKRKKHNTDQGNQSPQYLISGFFRLFGKQTFSSWFSVESRKSSYKLLLFFCKLGGFFIICSFASLEVFHYLFFCKVGGRNHKVRIQSIMRGRKKLERNPHLTQACDAPGRSFRLLSHTTNRS